MSSFDFLSSLKNYQETKNSPLAYKLKNNDFIKASQALYFTFRLYAFILSYALFFNIKHNDNRHKQ
ncbi:hypothetical protein GGR09_000230 [Bartonella heixiaziensis]